MTTSDRLDWCKRDAMRVLDVARREHFHKHEMTAAVVMVSGGNDSLTLAHLVRPHVSHIGMANTGVGVEETRQFVRDLAAEWQMPLIEKSPKPQDSYRTFVVRHGFPGPGKHDHMFQRLKERCFRQIRSDCISNPRKQRVLFIMGRRRAESKRRENLGELDRDGSIVYASPLINWTDDDMATYRATNDVPHNPVTDHLHMSGECLCGAFAGPGEEELVRFFYPDAMAQIDALAQDAANNGVRAKRCRWGWGAYEDWNPDQLALFDGSECDACAPFSQKVAMT